MPAHRASATGRTGRVEAMSFLGTPFQAGSASWRKRVSLRRSIVLPELRCVLPPAWQTPCDTGAEQLSTDHPGRQRSKPSTMDGLTIRHTAIKSDQSCHPRRPLRDRVRPWGRGGCRVIRADSKSTTSTPSLNLHKLHIFGIIGHGKSWAVRSRSAIASKIVDECDTMQII